MKYKHESIKGKEAEHHASIYGTEHVAAATGKTPNHSDSHPGFSAVQKKVESEGHSKEAAGAIVAAAARNASPAAKKANPNLKKVKG